MPVGIMCFTGLSVHYPAIVTLLEDSPHTEVIIDHFGFFLQGNYKRCMLYIDTGEPSFSMRRCDRLA